MGVGKAEEIVEDAVGPGGGGRSAEGIAGEGEVEEVVERGVEAGDVEEDGGNTFSGRSFAAWPEAEDGDEVVEMGNRGVGGKGDAGGASVAGPAGGVVVVPVLAGKGEGSAEGGDHLNKNKTPLPLFPCSCPFVVFDAMRRKNRQKGWLIKEKDVIFSFIKKNWCTSRGVTERHEANKKTTVTIGWRAN